MRGCLSESLLSVLLYVHTEVELFPLETPLADLTFKHINRHDGGGSRPGAVCSHLPWLLTLPLSWGPQMRPAAYQAPVPEWVLTHFQRAFESPEATAHPRLEHVRLG